MNSHPVATSASRALDVVGLADSGDCASDSSCEFLLKRPDPEYTSDYKRHGKAWDVKEDREVLPVSSQAFQVQDVPAPPPGADHCICGDKIGGVRTAKKTKDGSGKGCPVFSQKQGAYIVENAPELSNPFKSLDLTDAAAKPDARKRETQGWAPCYFTVQDYMDNGHKIPPLSYERSVPECAHFPITEALNDIKLTFKTGGRFVKLPDGQVYDQARLLCLIAVNRDQEIGKGRIKTKTQGHRRMNIHAPPSDWNDAGQIAILNRWKCQFRFRKTTQRSRESRSPWTTEQLDFLREQLLKDPNVGRKELTKRVNDEFDICRSLHSVHCAITRRLRGSGLLPSPSAAQPTMQLDTGEDPSFDADDETEVASTADATSGTDKYGVDDDDGDDDQPCVLTNGASQGYDSDCSSA